MSEKIIVTTSVKPIPGNRLPQIRERVYSSAVAEKEEPKRVVLTLTLNPSAKLVVEQIREDTGIPNTEAMVRLLEWFAAQDRKFRLAILTRDEATRQELMRHLANEMAGLEAVVGEVTVDNTTVEQAAAALRKLADRIVEIDRIKHGAMRHLKDQIPKKK